MNLSYKMGTDAITLLTENAKEFTRAASILGVFVVGCLVVCYGGTKLGAGANIPNGETHSVVLSQVTLSDEQLASGQYDRLSLLRVPMLTTRRILSPLCSSAARLLTARTVPLLLLQSATVLTW